MSSPSTVSSFSLAMWMNSRKRPSLTWHKAICKNNGRIYDCLVQTSDKHHVFSAVTKWSINNSTHTDSPGKGIFKIETEEAYICISVMCASYVWCHMINLVRIWWSGNAQHSKIFKYSYKTDRTYKRSVSGVRVGDSKNLNSPVILYWPQTCRQTEDNLQVIKKIN